MTRLNLMRTLKFKASRTALEGIYISFIRPLLEYSDSVLDNCSNEAKKNPARFNTHRRTKVKNIFFFCFFLGGGKV